MTRIALYTADGCSLCEPVRELLERIRDELGFELVEVEITDVPELERQYREWLPVVEIDGERAFVYHVDPVGLRRKLARVSGGG